MNIDAIVGKVVIQIATSKEFLVTAVIDEGNQKVVQMQFGRVPSIGFTSEWSQFIKDFKLKSSN